MWSTYQEAIFDYGRTTKRWGKVEAVAGSGKSTTAVELVSRLQGNILVSTFTNVIIEDALAKINAAGLRNVTAKTYNSFGAGMLYRAKWRTTLLKDYNGQKTDSILRHQILRPVSDDDLKQYYTVKSTIIRLVSLMKNLAILSASEAAARIDQIFDYYDFEIPSTKLNFKQVLLDTYSQCARRKDIIDYDDQKFFPVLYNLDAPTFSEVLLDEYQDTCPIESKLMMKAVSPFDGRVTVFGDSAQAIYSFKGAEPDAMRLFAEKNNAVHLPLSICYRCPSQVIEAAQEFVPHIEAAPGAIAGTVDRISSDDYYKRVTDKDMVLSRITQALVKSVTRLVGQGRAAFIQGREFGDQLADYVNTILSNVPGSTNWMPTKEFVHHLDEHYTRETARLEAINAENKLVLLESKYECVKVIMETCDTVDDIYRKITSMFTERGVGIRHLTIHKAKGLESHKEGNVYLLRPDKLPHPRVKKDHLLEEEKRLHYVALTRARLGFYYVTKEKDEK